MLTLKPYFCNSSCPWIPFHLHQWMGQDPHSLWPFACWLILISHTKHCVHATSVGLLYSLVHIITEKKWSWWLLAYRFTYLICFWPPCQVSTDDFVRGFAPHHQSYPPSPCPYELKYKNHLQLNWKFHQCWIPWTCDLLDVNNVVMGLM